MLCYFSYKFLFAYYCSYLNQQDIIIPIRSLANLVSDLASHSHLRCMHIYLSTDLFLLFWFSPGIFQNHVNRLGNVALPIMNLLIKHLQILVMQLEELAEYRSLLKVTVEAREIRWS